MYFVINIISTEPMIVDDPTIKLYSIINDIGNANTASLINLPVISTQNGPFRLVNI